MRSIGVPSVRRVVLRLTIGAFSIAALMGIVALLAPGHFGGLQGRVLLTTLVTGVTSVLTLCYLAIGDRPSRWIGLAGGLAAITSATSVLVIIWGHWQHDPGPGLSRTFGVSAIVALTAAQFCLLLAVVRDDVRPGSLVVRVQRSTLVAGSVVAALLVAAVLGWDPGSGAARVTGVVAILDVLGTLVTIAVGLFGTRRRAPDRSLTVVLPEPLAARLADRAKATGRDPADLVVEAVTRLVDSVGT